MGKWKWLVAVGLAMLLGAGAAQAADNDAEFVLQAIGTIEVSPDGSVLDYTLETELDPQVASLVNRTVRSWVFEPVIEDGRPVIATTRMRLDLEALPSDGDGFLLRVSDVVFGEPESRDNRPPEYPRNALDENVGAMVTLLLRLDGAGQVEEVHVEQVSLTDSMGKRGEFLRARFAEVSRRTALDWTYEINEIVDGDPEPMTVRVPVEFQMVNANGWSERREYIPGPVHPDPWKELDADGQPKRALAQGDVQPLDSRVALKNDVIGSIL